MRPAPPVITATGIASRRRPARPARPQITATSISQREPGLGRHGASAHPELYDPGSVPSAPLATLGTRPSMIVVIRRRYSPTDYHDHGHQHSGAAAPPIRPSSVALTSAKTARAANPRPSPVT